MATRRSTKTIRTLNEVLEDYLECEELFSYLEHEEVKETTVPPAWEGQDWGTATIGAEQVGEIGK